MTTALTVIALIVKYGPLVFGAVMAALAYINANVSKAAAVEASEHAARAYRARYGPNRQP